MNQFRLLKQRNLNAHGSVILIKAALGKISNPSQVAYLYACVSTTHEYLSLAVDVQVDSLPGHPSYLAASVGVQGSLEQQQGHPSQA
jgi:hypothetical protein